MQKSWKPSAKDEDEMQKYFHHCDKPAWFWVRQCCSICDTPVLPNLRSACQIILGQATPFAACETRAYSGGRRLVSEPDPRKIEKEGLVNGAGWKCTLCDVRHFIIAEPSVASRAFC